MQNPIHLTDAEMDAIFIAASPIAVDQRDAFLRHVARLLQGCISPGPGDVHRAIREAQRAHIDYPDLSRMHETTKHSRRA
jgi:hypothetical protein